MKKTFLSIALTSVLASSAMVSTSAVAEVGVTGNVGVTSNYLWRGVTQKDDNPAISGGVDFSLDSGLYAGAWASQAGWADGMSVEFDYYAGYSANVADTEITYDVGYIYYAYPDADEDVDFSEVYLGFAYDAYSVTFNTLSPDHGDADFGDDIYISLDAGFELVEGVDLALHLGSYTFDDGEDYNDYSFSLSSYGFTLTVSDTNLDGADGHVNAVLSYGLEF